MAFQSANNRLIETAYRQHSRQVLATLIRLLGGFELAEDGMHEAFVAAAQQWTPNSLPANARAWLISAGRFRAIDRLRKTARFDGFKTWL